MPEKKYTFSPKHHLHSPQSCFLGNDEEIIKCLAPIYVLHNRQESDFGFGAVSCN